jgi:dGTPase
MDWSDDVAYSVHDLEDAIVSGQVKLESLTGDIAQLFAMAKSGYLNDITEEEVESALVKLQSLSCWPTSYDGSHRNLARLKDLASQLIGRFALAAEAATRDRYGDGNLTRYSANLVVPREQRVEVALLKAMAGHYVISAESSQKRYADQQIVIKELVEMVFAGGEAALESFFVEDWREASTEAQRLRVAIDQIASLTDPGAYALHAKLSSQLRR